MKKMCTCAVHCTRDYCHDKACCEAPLCDCWCHLQNFLYEISDNLNALVCDFSDDKMTDSQVIDQLCELRNKILLWK